MDRLPSRWRAAVALLLLTSAVGEVGVAQVSTGGLRGIVRDESQGVVSGATVTVAGPARLGSPASATTNNAGQYRFDGLSVGVYTLTFSRNGFKTVRDEVVRVEVGRTIEHDVVLPTGSVSETVNVQPRRSVVDAEHAGSSTIFNHQLIHNVPSTRFSFFDTITYAPAVKTDQSTNVAVFNILGSNADQNSYQYDGVDISAPSFGSPWDFPNFDIMREVEVKTVGASAEYAGFQGGVVNIVTKSGSNVWKGVASYFAMDNHLVGNNTPGEEFPFQIDYQRDFTVEVGGPIVRDRMWVAGILQVFRARMSEVGVDPAGAPVLKRYRPFVKVNAVLSSRDAVEVLINDNNFWSPNPATRTAPPETILVEHGHNPVVVGRWVRTLGAASVLEVKGGGIYIRDRLDPYSGDLRTPGRFDYADGLSKANAGYTWRETENKTSIDVTMARSQDRWWRGTHGLKAGLQMSASVARTNDAYLQNVFFYDFNGPYLQERHEPSGTGGRVRMLGGFVQDDWAASRWLTLNLGLRLDRTTAGIPAIAELDDTSRVPTGRSFPAIDDLMSFVTAAPRLGVAARLDESGRTVAKASAGRYYGKLNTNMFSGVSPGNTSFDGFLFEAASGRYDTPSYSVASGANMRVDPDLRNQYTDQFSIGIERQILPDFGIDASFIAKRERNFIRQRDAAGQYAPVAIADEFAGRARTLSVLDRLPGSESVYLVTNRDDFRQSYKAFVLQAYKRWSRGWQLHASYVWQRALGIASGELGVRSQDFSSFGASRNFGRDPNDTINAYGRLPTDSTHGIKVAATYAAPRGIQMALRYSFESGRPYGRVVDALDLNQGVRQVLAEPRGTYELPAVNDLQFRADKAFELGGARALRISVDIYNLFNSDTALTVRNNSSQAGTDFGQTLTVFAPRRAMLGLRLQF